MMYLAWRIDVLVYIEGRPDIFWMTAVSDDLWPPNIFLKAICWVRWSGRSWLLDNFMIARPYSNVGRMNCLYRDINNDGGKPRGFNPRGTRENRAAKPACLLWAISSCEFICPLLLIGTPRYLKDSWCGIGVSYKLNILGGEPGGASITHLDGFHLKPRSIDSLSATCKRKGKESLVPIRTISSAYSRELIVVLGMSGGGR